MSIGSSVTGAVGGAIGSAFGGPVGGAIGKVAGSILGGGFQKLFTRRKRRRQAARRRREEAAQVQSAALRSLTQGSIERPEGGVSSSLGTEISGVGTGSFGQQTTSLFGSGGPFSSEGPAFAPSSDSDDLKKQQLLGYLYNQRF
jgi:hypothetical protein